MRSVLVTGSSGQVGRRLVERFEHAGWRARRFDLRSGGDLRDEEAEQAAVDG